MENVKRVFGRIRYEVKISPRTLPSRPSNNLTGQSLTEATTQKAGGLCCDAPGYHTKSTIGADCGNVLACTRDGEADADDAVEGGHEMGCHRKSSHPNDTYDFYFRPNRASPRRQPSPRSRNNKKRSVHCEHLERSILALDH